MLRKYVFGFLIWVIYRTLSWTWKLELEEPEELLRRLKNHEPMIMAHWHGDEIALLQLIRRYRIATIASTSKDGEMMNTVIRLLGGQTSRGSSTRGAVGALKGLLRLMKAGANCSFAVDGPKGPLHKVKPGVFETSRIIRCPLFIAGVACDRKIVFRKSWNRTFLPKPFARVRILWKGPWGPVTSEQDPKDPQLAFHLEEMLHGASREAHQDLGLPLEPLVGSNR